MSREPDIPTFQVSAFPFKLFIPQILLSRTLSFSCCSELQLFLSTSPPFSFRIQPFIFQGHNPYLEPRNSSHCLLSLGLAPSLPECSHHLTHSHRAASLLTDPPQRLPQLPMEGINQRHTRLCSWFLLQCKVYYNSNVHRLHN